MKTKKVLMCGNEAIAEAAIRAGCSFYAGYPITPQNELTAYMASHMKASGGVFIQSESEIAAINIVLGAAAAGARAMTSSSSPGISLKQEGISYIAGAQLPAVIVNIMRGGPGLGNIAPAQGDYFQSTKGGGHGDYRMIVLAPSSVQEMFDFTTLAFELADCYRNPVLLLGDGLLGQMMEPIVIKSNIKYQKSNIKKPWALTGAKNRESNIIKSFYIKEGDLEKFNIKLQEKYKLIEKKMNLYEAYKVHDAKIIFVAYGSSARICRAVVDKARAAGKKIGLIRPKVLWPYPSKAIQKLTKNSKMIFVVEMSAGQMVEDVRLAVCGKVPVEFYGRMGGGIPQESDVLKQINKYYAKIK